MSGPVVKKCMNCRVDLADNNNGMTQCQKCIKNESKYGKATTCQFCQLNAAFHERKCVWCAHSERKFGSPIQCANCHLSCAFPKSERSRKEGKTLCRLCIMQARKNKLTMLAGVSVPLNKDKKEKNGHNKDKNSQKRRILNKSETIDESPMKIGRPSGFEVVNSDSLVDHESQIKIQKLNDEINRLNCVIQTKDTLLMEKDKMINGLKAENYNQEKKHRERILKFQKEKEESIRLIEQIRAERNKSKK